MKIRFVDILENFKQQDNAPSDFAEKKYNRSIEIARVIVLYLHT